MWAFEIILSFVNFAAIYVVFGKLHYPDSKWKKIVSVVIMLLDYPIRVVIFLLGLDIWINVAIELPLCLALAYLCRREGDLVRPIISAFYAFTMFMLIIVAFGSFSLLWFGPLAEYGDYSLPMWIGEAVELSFCVIWACFYRYVARKMASNAPAVFSLLIILMPVIAIVIVATIGRGIGNMLQFNSNSWQTAVDSGTFLYVGLFSILIIVINMCTFYFYVRLSISNESLRLAQELAHTPPLWTAEQGLSATFIEKYQLTEREQQVVNILLLGKSDKDIAIELDIAVGTVQSHLKHVYRKTEMAGRFALASLVRGE
ncbi:MAG: helix-turn-helix transcriptional regulator [Deferribacteraceae bacterium]|jgi:DNA-binding CsgD family transcriptional regulator|nr:helix-turn-helix transcriptional regulator [Deferribacteraceae bacterium]